MINVLIVGLGNIGTRHLQSLINAKNKINFYILEKNNKNIHNFKINFLSNKLIHNFFFFNNVIKLKKKKFNFSIFSTSSDVRLFLLKKILKNNIIKNILFEKVVFQSSKQFDLALELINKFNIKSWVNCPRRSLIFFKNLKKKIIYKNKFELIHRGSNWGLCSNAIHFFDLFSYFVKKKIIYKKNLLKKKVIRSKRKNFYELCGTLILSTKDHKEKLILNCQEGNKVSSFTEIKFDNFKIKINNNKSKENVFFYKNNKIFQKKTFLIPFQSAMSLGIMNKILNFNKCNLISLKDSYELHEVLLDIFTKQFNLINGTRIINCPIT